MDQESLVIMLMIAAPAVLGLFALIASIVLFGTAGKKEDAYRTVKLIFGVLLMTVALGIGACYGVMLFGGLGVF